MIISKLRPNGTIEEVSGKLTLIRPLMSDGSFADDTPKERKFWTNCNYTQAIITHDEWKAFTNGVLVVVWTGHHWATFEGKFIPKN